MLTDINLWELKSLVIFFKIETFFEFMEYFTIDRNLGMFKI